MSALKVINPFDQSVYFEAPYASWEEVKKTVEKPGEGEIKEITNWEMKRYFELI